MEQKEPRWVLPGEDNRTPEMIEKYGNEFLDSLLINRISLTEEQLIEMTKREESETIRGGIEVMEQKLEDRAFTVKVYSELHESYITTTNGLEDAFKEFPSLIRDLEIGNFVTVNCKGLAVQVKRVPEAYGNTVDYRGYSHGADPDYC